MKINFTNHSKKRMQQRGISEQAVMHIIQQGDHQYDGHGAKVYFINRKHRELRPSYISTDVYKRIRKQLNGYVVVAEGSGSVITVGHRIKRSRN